MIKEIKPDRCLCGAGLIMGKRSVPGRIPDVDGVNRATNFYHIYCPNCRRYGKEAISKAGAAYLWNSKELGE